MLSAKKIVSDLKETIISTNERIESDNLPIKTLYYLSSIRKNIGTLVQLVELLDFFEIEWFEDNKPKIKAPLDELMASLPSDDLRPYELIVELFECLFNKIGPKLEEKIASLSNDENKRLNEAFNCYYNELNYSSVVMSVSAIEARLFSLMQSMSNDRKLDQLTLGQLIKEYAENKDKYGYVLPKKHEPLLEYCNTYRKFSVHPKSDKITRSNATTILCMTCSFLFDGNLKHLADTLVKRK
jgi:hypothetical protein